LKEQSDIQSSYIKDDPFVTPEKGTTMLTVMKNLLENRKKLCYWISEKY